MRTCGAGTPRGGTWAGPYPAGQGTGFGRDGPAHHRDGALRALGQGHLLRRHGSERRLATLVATVVQLQARTVDEVLELLDLLMTTRLLAQAERESVKEKARHLPRLSAESAKLAAAVSVLLEAHPRPGGGRGG